ncbi:MAG: hypothetical protein Q8R28_13475 [Dehalococcoidia bacterium]|nr:hypothetical protein [Dehalococcoidia bacterium]
MRDLILKRRNLAARMGDHTFSIERFAGDRAVPLAEGGKVKPGELIRLSVQHIGSLIDPTVHFIVTGPEGVVLDQAKSPALTSSQVSLDFTVPPAFGVYTAEAWLHSFPLLPLQHVVRRTFEVSTSAPAPIAPPGGGFNIGDIKPILFAVLGIVAIGAVSNVIRR